MSSAHAEVTTLLMVCECKHEHRPCWGLLHWIDVLLCHAGTVLPGAYGGALGLAAGDAAAGQGDQGGGCVQVRLLPDASL